MRIFLFIGKAKDWKDLNDENEFEELKKIKLSLQATLISNESHKTI